jgi:hypothetical protein
VKKSEVLAQAVQQSTLTLPHFHYEMPVLYLADGVAYIPVVEFCKMLGLRAETYIPRWRRRMVWCHARKLYWRLPTGRTRIVWCLHLGALPFLCACFNWSLVTPARREQLRQATDAWLIDVVQAQRVLLDRYRALRSDLFAFLEAYSDAETWLNQWALRLSATLDLASSRQVEALLSQGKILIGQATAQAREMVQEQATAPLIDVVTLDEHGAVTEVETQPLFPVVPGKDREQFFASVRKLAQWHREIAAFIGGPERSQDSDQSREG